jgi:cytosine deaminase
MDDADILIRNAVLRGGMGPVSIAVRAGRIAAIHPPHPHPLPQGERGEEGLHEIDAQGRLVTESFVNPHLHLDKVYTLQMLDDEALRAYHGGSMEDAAKAIDLASRVKARYDRAWIIENVRNALWEAVRFGTTHLLALADVDTKARLEGVAALIQARDEFKGIIEIRVVAFPQDGVVREPGAAELVREAMAMGADVVGGIPWIEPTERDMQRHIDEMFNIAREFDRPVAMLVDDAGRPELRTLEMMARRAIEQGWEGRVLAHHARAMALYDDWNLEQLVRLLKKARMGIVTDPHTGPLHVPVRTLLKEDVLVCLGQDDISDAYYPYGRNNMLEVAFLASHLLWMTTSSDMEKLYDMITVDAARAMWIQDHKLEVGAPADLVVLNASSVLEAFRSHEAPSYVISRGKIVAEAGVSRTSADQS